MANLGEVTEIVNASELTLDLGSDRFILLKNLQVHVGRPEFRDPTTDGGALYSYGKGDNFFTATLVMSTPELDGATTNFNALSQIDANGDMTSTAFKVVATDISGTSKTMACTGVLREYDVRKPEEGKVEIDIFVRITGDTLTIS